MTDLVPVCHGAQRRADLASVIGEYAVRADLRQGTLTQLWPGVVVPRARLLDPTTRAAAALLYVGDGAVICGPTAASLYGYTAADGTDVHVTVPYNRWVRRRPGLILHHDRFWDEDVVALLGMPVLALDLVIAELLCTAPRRLALACADQAIAAAGANGESFLFAIGERLVRRSDRRGTRRADVLLGLVTGRADSPPESWLRLLVVDAGYPVPVAQYEVRDLAGRLLYVLDLAWPALRVALEYDGYEAHEGRESSDAQRDAWLNGRGWIVIRVRADDLRDPVRMLAELASAFRSRRYSA